MPLPQPNDETTPQLQGDDPIPSGAASPPKPAAAAKAVDPQSAAFYDSVLALPEADREKVIDDMHPEDLQGFLDHTAQKQAAPETAQTAPQDAVPYAPGIKAPPQDETVTEVPLVNKDGAPAVGHLDRALAQNFANDAEGQAAFYRKNYPGLEFQVFSKAGQPLDSETQGAMAATPPRYQGMAVPPQQTGASSPTDRVYVRPRGSKVWSAVDPDTGFHPLEAPKEAAQDLGDSAYRIAAGVPVAAATAAGGLAGGEAGFPLVGAGLAGGGVNAAAEALRQAVGGELGMNKAPDVGQVVSAGVTGAATPFILGTGATPAAAAARGVEYGGQRGLVGRAVDKLIPGVSSWLSGIPADDIRFARDNLPAVKNLEQAGPGGLQGYVADTMSQIKNALKSQRDALQSNVTDLIDQTGTKVDLGAVKKPYKDAIAALEAKKAASGLSAPEQSELQNLKNEYVSNFFRSPNASQEQILTQMRAHLTVLDDELRQTYPQAVSDPAKYQQFAQVAQQRDALAADIQRILKSGIEMPDQVGAQDAMRIRRNLQDAANFTTGSANNRYAGLTNPEKNIQAQGSSSYQAINAAIDNAVKSSSSARGAPTSVQGLWDRYSALKQIEDALGPLTGSTLEDQFKAAKVLRNLASPANAGRRYLLQGIDPSLVRRADVLHALAQFGDKASATALNGYGSTSTTKTTNAANIFGGLGGALGGLAGFFAGGADQDFAGSLEHGGIGASAGYAGGRALGPVLSSPKALRMYMNVGRVPRVVGGAARPAAGVLSPWAIDQIKKEYQGAAGQ